MENKANKGKTASEETHRKNSESHKGKKRSPFTEDHKRRISEAKIGHIVNDETKRKMSEAKKGMYDGKKHPMYGRHHSTESKLKMSKNRIGKQNPNQAATLRGRHLSEETKIKISKALKGKPRPKEVILKISQSNKGKKQSDEQRKKRSQLYKNKFNGENNPFFGKKHSEDTKKKISDSKIGMCCGELHPRWQGGRKITRTKAQSKRERELGFITLNEWESNTKNFVAHHLDKEYVLYIPKELHTSNYHRQPNQESMNIINEKVIDWYIAYYGLI